ncbi:MAG: flavodoxin family protein [Candidatus Methanofastidiosia archaeon]
MRTLVVYYSKTGNTKKVAEVVARELGTDVASIDEKPNIENYDLVVFGTPTHGGKPAKEMWSYMQKIPETENKKAAVFISSGGSGGDKNTMGWMKKFVEDKGMKFIGGFSTIGEWKGLFSTKNVGRPNEKDLEDARGFVKWLEEQLDE